MRLAPVIALLISSAAHAADTPEQKATVTVVNQHMVINVLSAMYHCENGQWPHSVAELRTFKEAGKITLPVEPDWTMLGSADFAVEIAENILVRSPSGIIPNAYAVASKNSPPGCQKGNLQVNAEMHIGE